MTADEWRAYLERYSKGLIAYYDLSPSSGRFSEEARRKGWLGVAPATNEAIADTERRLGVTLPPSLKAFYAVTNGWPHDFNLYARMQVLPVEQIGWYRDIEEIWLAGGLDTAEKVDAYLATDEPYPEERAWLESLMRSLAVSSEGEEAAIILLDPEQVNEAGEWAAARPEVVSAYNTEWQPCGFSELFAEEAAGEWWEEMS
jgi:hypothetical protein